MIKGLTSKAQAVVLEVSFLKEIELIRLAVPSYSCVKVLESSPFNGAQSAKTLENFHWDVDQ